MSPRPRGTVPARAPHGWPQALLTVLVALAAMIVVAALGLWAAGAGDLPDSALPRVVAATVVSAVGGTVRLSGDLGEIAGSRGDLTAIPLSVTLVGALVVGAGFLRPLRRRAVAGVAELAGWAARIAVLWLLALLGLSLLARHTFRLSLGEGTVSRIAELLGVSPRVGFRTDVVPTLGLGLAWLAGVLVLALLVAPGAPLPPRLLRFHAAVRPAAYAMLLLLLVCVALGLVVAVVSACTRGHVRETAAVVLLGLPNVAWPVFTIGLGAVWDGHVTGRLGLPLPDAVEKVLRGSQAARVDLRSLSEYDGRVWWLVVLDVVLVLGAAFVLAARSRGGVPVWRLALRSACALAVTVLVICLVGRVSAHFGLSVLGIGGLGADGRMFLDARTARAVGLGALWGLVAGLLAAFASLPLRRRRAARA